MGMLQHMDWLTAALLRVLFANILFQIVLKYVAMKHRRVERLLWQYVWALVLAGTAAVVVGAPLWIAGSLLVVIVGFFNGFGAYFQWQAVAISQSRTALFTYWDDIIGMTLSFVVFHEAQSVHVPTAAGIALSFLALFLFIRHGWRKKAAGEPAVSLRLYKYIGLYSVIWGVAIFAQRYWAFERLPFITFLLAWYAGALVAVLALKTVYRDPADARTPPLTVGDVAQTCVLALFIVVSLGLGVISYKAPQAIVQPIYLVAEMICPALIGLFLFNERRRFDREEWWYFALGALGALIIALTFRT